MTLTVTQFRKRLEALRTERTSWMEHWQDISDYVLPRRGRFLVSDRNKGDKRHTNIIDNTGIIALRTLASGMMSGITSPARPWFRLATPDPTLMEQRGVKEWLGDVEALMREVFNRSNLYNALDGVYEELGAYGTGAMLVHEDFDNVIRCQTLTAGEYCIGLSKRFEADTLYREFSMTVGQLADEFGEDALSRSTRGLYQRGAVDEWVDVVHAIEPNRGRARAKKDARNKPWRSVWFEAGALDDEFLRVSGFDEFPAMCPRWHAIGSDIYGRSPAMEALGDVKQLQVQEKRKSQAIDKMVNPPLAVPSTLRNAGQISTLPGDLNYYDAVQGQVGATALYQVQPRLQEMQIDMNVVRQRVRDALYADLFLMIAQADGQMTATEVRIRQEEKLLMLGPVLERLHHELLNPLIDRTFSIMVRAGLVPEPPPALQGLDLKVEYISMLAQAQKAAAVAGIERLAGYVGQMAAADPSALDKFDIDQSIDTYADAMGTPPRIVRSDEAVAELRQQRAQAQQAAQQVEMMRAAAEGAKTMSETETSGGNLLSQITGGAL